MGTTTKKLENPNYRKLRTHPFLDVVLEVLVEKHGIRVIMTTHSPSTVALAPEGSVFEMNRDGERIVRAPSRAHAVNLLTSGLVTVGPSTRYVLVEDEADVEFYSASWSLLIERRPTTVPALTDTPSLVFIRASVGQGGERTGGGKALVEGWVTKFVEAGLSPQFQGLIDRDSGNPSSESVQVLGRYSIENYLLDPVCIYTLLLQVGAQPELEGIVLGIGEEHTIRTLDDTHLQRIADVILDPIQTSLQDLEEPERERVDVRFTNGNVLRYPRWLLERKGKDLLLIFQQQYGGARRINQQQLLRSYLRLRLIPLDLKETFEALQYTEG